MTARVDPPGKDEVMQAEVARALARGEEVYVLDMKEGVSPEPSTSPWDWGWLVLVGVLVAVLVLGMVNLLAVYAEVIPRVVGEVVRGGR